LKAQQTVTHIGTYDILVIKGAVTIYGAILTADDGPRRVFAPSTHALPVIKCLSREAEVQIKHVPGSGLVSLRIFSPLYGRFWNHRTKEQVTQLTDGHPDRRSFSLLTASNSDSLKRDLVDLNIDSTWNKTIDELASSSNPSIVLVCGPRNSGKSTFCRILSNRLLSSGQRKSYKAVWHLDLDSTVSEYTSPGQVSIGEITKLNFGPPYTHPVHNGNVLRTALPLAAADYRDRPEYFLKCVDDLVKHSLNSVGQQRLPLIIDTPPIAPGAANDVILKLASRLRLTDVITIGRGQATWMIQLEKAIGNARLTKCETQPFNGRLTHTRDQLRDMAMISYFHSTGSGELTWNRTPLSFRKPLALSYRAHELDFPHAGFAAFVTVGQMVEPHHLIDVLNGSLVSIMVRLDPSSTPDRKVLRDDMNDIPYVAPNACGIVEPLDPTAYRLCGVGAIRAIDAKRKQLHMLFPHFDWEQVGRHISPKRLFLVHGAMETPDWAYLEDKHWLTYHQRRQERLEGEAAKQILREPSPDEGYDDEVQVTLREDRRVKEVFPAFYGSMSTPWVDTVDDDEERVKGDAKWSSRRFAG